jgi:hypothetical protein
MDKIKEALFERGKLALRPAFIIKGCKKLGDGTTLLTEIGWLDISMTANPMPLPGEEAPAV